MINNYRKLLRIGKYSSLSYIINSTLYSSKVDCLTCAVGSGGLRPVFSKCACSTETVSPSCRIKYMINDYGCIAE